VIMKEAQKRKGVTTMQSTNLVAIMAILNAIVQRYNDDAVKMSLATLGQPFGTAVASNTIPIGNGKTKQMAQP